MSALPPDPPRQGFVLVNALVIVAALAVAATLLLARAEGGRVRLVAMQQADALTHALDAFEALGRTMLDRDLVTGGAVDSAADTWARSTIDVPLEIGRVSGSVTDAQARFNINWLSNPDDTLALEGWPVLLRRIGIAAGVGEAIAAYVSAQGPTNRAPFAGLTPPIAPLGGSIVLLDQLAALPGLDPEDLALLHEHTSALPATSKVNLNTASRDVLLAMVPQLSLAQLDVVLLRRAKEPYPSVEVFFEELGVSIDPEDPDAANPSRYAVRSDWFIAQITATLETRRATRHVLLRRESPPAGTQIEWRVSRF